MLHTEERHERLLTLSQAARRLGIHDNTLRKWSDDARIQTVKLPSGHRRFQSSVIERARQQMGYTTAEQTR